MLNREVSFLFEYGTNLWWKVSRLSFRAEETVLNLIPVLVKTLP